MCISAIIADDHALLRQGLAALLRESSDIELLGEASDGEDAWRLITLHHPQVAILDLSMPKLSGIDVALQVRAAAIDTETVLLTMYSEPATAIYAEAAGIAGFVAKTSSFDDLVLAVRTVAGGGTFVSPAVRKRLRTMRQGGAPPSVPSPRELEVLRLMAAGHTAKEIGRLLGISPRTVDTHRWRAMDKLHLDSTAELIRWTVESGLMR